MGGRDDIGILPYVFPPITLQHVLCQQEEARTFRCLWLEGPLRQDARRTKQERGSFPVARMSAAVARHRAFRAPRCARNRRDGRSCSARREQLVHVLNCDRTLSHGGCDSLGRGCANVTDGEEARKTRLERIRRTLERPMMLTRPGDLHAGADEPLGSVNTSPGRKSVFGIAPMKTNKLRIGRRTSSPVPLLRQRIAVSCVTPVSGI